MEPSISGQNSLNRSMQGLWTQHRRTKLNLNSAPPSSTPSGSTTPVPTPAVDDGAGGVVNGTGDALNSEPSTSTPQPQNGTTSPPPKRKTRTTRPPEDSKRPKLSSVDPSSSRSYLPSSKPSPSKTDQDKYAPPQTRLADLGGVDAPIEKLLELVAMPLKHPEIYLHTGVQPPRGVLLHGPPGCGKTLLANAIAGELQVPFISISAPSVVSGMSGESEKTLREVFAEAKRLAPSLLFIDEIDAITPKRESAQREMERRIVAQFLTCMDDLSWTSPSSQNDPQPPTPAAASNPAPVIVIGATNRPDSLDVALRRAGRFDHEICMGVPDEEGREKILRVLSQSLRLSGDFDFKALAKATPGYVGADLAALTGAAGIVAVKRMFGELVGGGFGGIGVEGGVVGVGGDDMGNVVLDGVHDDDGVANGVMGDEQVANGEDSMLVDPPALPLTTLQSTSTPTPINPSTILSFLHAHPNPLTPHQLSPLYITHPDFLSALSSIQPSSTREGFTTIPSTTYADIGALAHVREELNMAVVQPIRRPEVFRRVGVEAGCGVLMWGPPGCGKTLLAKAVANESRANFISVKGPELLNKYVGESERAVRQVFTRARASAPCVIFFDELDALVPRRDDSLSESSARVVNTLLTELDGLDSRKGVYVIAATNRPDMIDPAMCRPGRLDKLLYVDLPSPDERVEIFRTVSRKVPFARRAGEGTGERDVKKEVEELVREKCDGYSGADLASIVREAGVMALKRTLGRLDLMGQGPEGGAEEDEVKIEVGLDDFVNAVDKIGPSVSVAQRKKYESLRNKFAGLPVRGGRKMETGDQDA
ncbi:hypothetical protein JAAARDRAFT_33836 [Jaapia argillacea MUCL 33604]|uniref:AAA+ ATPase domain-containing protein n=1 Tax=Jaapia argillacea MUCL 33604 TaxID=933084 RepID=A0A067PWA7_9AGAM|nr:hypothetical protein JAAARDRAFT_33836 [Jaapia argillacea MUCL 33604]